MNRCNEMEIFRHYRRFLVNLRAGFVGKGAAICFRYEGTAGLPFSSSLSLGSRFLDGNLYELYAQMKKRAGTFICSQSGFQRNPFC